MNFRRGWFGCWGYFWVAGVDRQLRFGLVPTRRSGLQG